MSALLARAVIAMSAGAATMHIVIMHGGSFGLAVVFCAVVGLVLGALFAVISE